MGGNPDLGQDQRLQKVQGTPEQVLLLVQDRQDPTGLNPLDQDQAPALYRDQDPVEQDLGQNRALLLWPDPVQDPPGQNQDPGQDQNLGPSLDLAPNQFQDPGRGQNQDLVQNRRN